MIINSKYNFLKPYKVKKLIRLGRNFDGGYLVCSQALKSCKTMENQCKSIEQKDKISKTSLKPFENSLTHLKGLTP